MKIEVDNMDYDKINYDKREHLVLIESAAKKIGYNPVEALIFYNSLEAQYHDLFNKKNGKQTRIISNEAKEHATKEMMEVLKMHVK